VNGIGKTESTDMGLGSGGVAYYCFNCSGENIIVDDMNFYHSLSERDIVWTNVCLN